MVSLETQILHFTLKEIVTEENVICMRNECESVTVLTAISNWQPVHTSFYFALY